MSQNGQEIVITGAGMITCLGQGRETTWRAVQDRRCGMGPLTAMEQPLPDGKDGGQAVDLPDDEDAGHPREVRYLRRAIRDALADARLVDAEAIPYAPERCAVLFGTTLHGMRAAGEYLRSGKHDPLRHFLAASTLRGAGRDLGHFTGLAATTCSACSSSLGSVALAVTLLRSGEFDCVIAGGYDPVSEYVYGGFNSLRLVAEGPLRPFARGRSGMKLAEGYGAVVIERAATARQRGITKPVARILGCGESADAHHLTQPHPQGDGAARAILGALKSADLTPDQIDLVAAHATGTPDNDAGEYAALARAFGPALSKTPVVGFKSHLGHTLGGAGVVELILSAMALRDGVVPACANVKPEDVEFEGLNLSTGAPRPAALRTSLNTSLGFGGANTCVILGRAETLPPSPLYSGERAGVRGSSNDSMTQWPDDSIGNSPSPQPSPVSTGERGQCTPTPRDVFITGVGVAFPGAIGHEAFVARLADPDGSPVTDDTGPLNDESIAHLVNARRVRRMSEYVKVSLAATTLAYRDAGIADAAAFSETCSAILGSTHGSSHYSSEYYGQIVREGIPAANPLLFAEGVPNAAAAHLSLMLSLKGACQTIIGTRTAGLDALRLAAARIAAGEWDRAVVSAGEEYCALVNETYRHCGVYAGRDGGAPFGGTNGFATGCGAVTLVLESRASMDARSFLAAGGSPRGKVERCASAASFREKRAEVDLTARVLRDLGGPTSVISSANGTWIDRSEAAALRLVARDTRSVPTVSSIYGHIAETFSAGPLAALSAVLLTGRLPVLLGSPDDGLRHAGRGGTRVASFGVICTDYTGLVSGARIGVTERAAA
jgi:3-oxoacyl-[acyl-carrier-protein] synthase II